MLVLAESGGVIHDRLAAELADIEARFTDELASDLSCVNELVAHVERYRGKMLRPTLVLVTAMASEPNVTSARDSQRVLGTVVEMVHMATLVHDDILDDAEMRRRGATINHLAGNEAAVMLGDYLISHAYHLCSSLEDQRISRLIADATNTVCEGELLQLANRNNAELTERTYFEIIRRKTASLCGTCCRAAAILGGTSDTVADALHLYGEKLGLAFQIVDDLLDLTGDEQTVGKTLGRDLEKGKLTLPIIHSLAHADPATRAELADLLSAAPPATDSNGDRNGHASADLTAAAGRLRELLNETDSVACAQQRAAGMVESAKAAATEHLPESPARGLMLEMADAVLRRRF